MRAEIEMFGFYGYLGLLNGYDIPEKDPPKVLNYTIKDSKGREAVIQFYYTHSDNTEHFYELSYEDRVKIIDAINNMAERSLE